MLIWEQSDDDSDSCTEASDSDSCTEASDGDDSLARLRRIVTLV
jgi:hypothetical protein